MALRFQLINEIVGTITIEREDPIDINSIPQLVKRSEQYSGIVYEIIFDIEFIKGGKAFAKAAYEQAGGIDAIVICNIYELDPNLKRWKIYGTGQFDYNRYDLGETTVVVNIEQTGVERRVLNLMEQDVNLETQLSENGSSLPEQITHQVEHHSKTLLKEFITTPSDEGQYQQLDVATLTLPNISPPLDPDVTVGFVSYAQIDNTNVISDELTENFSTPYGFTTYPNPFADDQVGGVGDLAKYTTFLSDPSRLDTRNPQYEADENGEIEIKVKLKLKHKVYAVDIGDGDVDIGGEGILGNVEVFAFCEKRNSEDEIVYIEEIGQWDMSGIGGTERIGEFETKTYTKASEAVAIGDQFFVYCTYRVYGTYESPHQAISGPSGVIRHDFIIEADEENTYISFKNLTVSEPSEVRSILIYECVERCVQYYTNQVDCFRSNLLGRTDLGYAVDGPGSLIVLHNGYRLRGISSSIPVDLNTLQTIFKSRPLIASLKYLLDFINARYCIGFGFEFVDGKQIFRLELIEYFFNKNLKIMSLGKVYRPKKRAYSKGYYNMIECGYTTKLNTKSTNGIDEFNTLRRYIIPIVNTKNQLKVATDMITAGHIIERQRRLQKVSEDSEWDDRNFAVVVVRDGLSGYKSKKNEGYSAIENVVSPETGYNYDLAPSECAQAWFKVIAAGLIRAIRTKELRFSYGEVNYRMKRTKDGQITAISEDGNFDITNIEPIWDNELYKIPTVKFTREQMAAIKANPYGYIEFEDRLGNKFEGFISYDGVEHESVKRKAELTLLRVYRQIL
jgi:hypothetical protein